MQPPGAEVIRHDTRLEEDLLCERGTLEDASVRLVRLIYVNGISVALSEEGICLLFFERLYVGRSYFGFMRT